MSRTDLQILPKDCLLQFNSESKILCICAAGLCMQFALLYWKCSVKFQRHSSGILNRVPLEFKQNSTKSLLVPHLNFIIGLKTFLFIRGMPEGVWYISIFFCHFYKGEQLCDFLFAFFGNKILQLALTLTGWMFLGVYPQCKGGKNENERIASPESVAIYLKTSFVFMLLVYKIPKWP